MKKNLLKTLIVICGLGYLLSGCAYRNDVEFARSVLKQLIEDRYAVRSLIDWPVLVMLDQNVGAKYSAQPDDKQKLEFQRAFIEGFSRGFRPFGVPFKKFFNWRMLGVDETNPKTNIVAANYANKEMLALFYITHDGAKRKLTNFQIVTVALEGKALSAQGEKRDAAPKEE